MDYFDLLAKIIKQSGLTHAEIARRCEEDYNVAFDDNYISTYKNRRSIIPDEKSRAIAKACGRHEELLVIQAYYDKSPQAFKDMFDSIIKIVKPIVLVGCAQQSDEAATEIENQRLDGMAFGEWMELDLPDLSKQIDVTYAELMDIDKFKEFTNIIVTKEAENVCTHIAPDDSLHPTIPNGAKVKTILVALDGLKDGDFVCFPKDDTDEIYIREIEFLYGMREKMLLKALNGKGIKSELVVISANRLYEKVVQVIIDFS